MVKRYRENGTLKNYARPGRPPKLSPSDKSKAFIFEREEKIKLHSYFRSEKVHRCFCPSFHFEKTTQHYQSERMCRCQEEETEKKDISKSNKEASFQQTVD